MGFVARGKTPTAFHPSAQGWREPRAPTLGRSAKAPPTLQGLHPPVPGAAASTLSGLVLLFELRSQGSARRTTLGWLTERRWRSPRIGPIRVTPRATAGGAGQAGPGRRAAARRSRARAWGLRSVGFVARGKTPTAFHPSAQGWREPRAPTLGRSAKAPPTLQGLHPPVPGAAASTLSGLAPLFCFRSQGSARRATLDWLMERRWRSPRIGPIRVTPRSTAGGAGRAGPRRRAAARWAWAGARGRLRKKPMVLSMVGARHKVLPWQSPQTRRQPSLSLKH